MESGNTLPFLAMILVQVGYAGMNIISKLALDSGMNPYVLVAYRQMFATLAILPFAYFFERRSRPKITKPILFQILLSSIFGVTMNQVFYYVGLKNSTPTIACALSNLLPAVTFILAVPFRLEKVGIRGKAGQAKVTGTIVCVAGAMLLSFYNGGVIGIGQSGIHWKYAEDMSNGTSTHDSNVIMGTILLIASCIAWAVWFIIQAKMCETFSAPYTSSALMCLMASIECGIIALCFEHNIAAWSLTSNIRLITTLYAAIVGSALAYCLMTWCIQKKGPLYVSVFSPLLLVLVAILSWTLLKEKLYIGTVVGSVLIVFGLYAVLWGKNTEIKEAAESMNVLDKQEKYDMEMQFYDLSDTNLHVMTTVIKGEKMMI